MLELPTRADVALVKAPVADEHGSRRGATVVQVSKVVPLGGLDLENIVTPSIHVDRVPRIDEEQQP